MQFIQAVGSAVAATGRRGDIDPPYGSTSLTPPQTRFPMPMKRPQTVRNAGPESFSYLQIIP